MHLLLTYVYIQNSAYMDVCAALNSVNMFTAIFFLLVCSQGYEKQRKFIACQGKQLTYTPLVSMQSLAEVNHSSLQKQHYGEDKNDQIRFSFQLVVSQIVWQAKLTSTFHRDFDLSTINVAIKKLSGSWLYTKLEKRLLNL